jgi:hypothetical protein
VFTVMPLTRKLTLRRAGAGRILTLYKAASLILVPAGTSWPGGELGVIIPLSFLTNFVTAETVTCKPRAEWTSSVKPVTSES